MFFLGNIRILAIDHLRDLLYCSCLCLLLCNCTSIFVHIHVRTVIVHDETNKTIYSIEKKTY